MLHLSPSHRMVSEALATAIAAAPERREAIDMRAVDFGALYQLSVKPEELHTLRISLWSRCFDEVLSAVGQPFFAELYGKMLEPEAGQGFSITLVLNLDHIPPDQVECLSFPPKRYASLGGVQEEWEGRGLGSSLPTVHAVSTAVRPSVLARATPALQLQRPIAKIDPVTFCGWWWPQSGRLLVRHSCRSCPR
eukprot:scaffold23287_cov36-Tisochrysis_lutea.AAC.1